MTLNVLFEDNHLIVCVKPAGVLSQADGKNLPDMLSMVKEYLKVKYQKPGNVYCGLVHRLDLNVGGVMVFAKTSKAAARLSAAIRTRVFSKRYYAVVEGEIPPETRKTLIDWLVKDETARTAVIAGEGTGKQAVLSYLSLGVAKTDEGCQTLLDIKLESGRFHQIRVQLAHEGHPLVGDAKYGNAHFAGGPLGLYAYEIGFEHPIGKEPLIFRQNPQADPFAAFPMALS